MPQLDFQKQKFRFSLTPQQVLVLGFLFFILAGTVLLCLPAASATGESIGFVDAFFMATSAVCVTGLVVRDLATELSGFGQSTVLILIQLGGLGYMTSVVLMALVLGRKVGLKDRIMMHQALNLYSLEGLIGFMLMLVKITFGVELIAAAILTARFYPAYGLPHSAFLGVFHSISAFNNAGFSVFSNSLVDYRTDLVINVTMICLIIMGGIGFFVYSDLYNYYKKQVINLTMHTKMVLYLSFFLTLSLAFLIFCFEFNNSEVTTGIFELLPVALFQSVSTRTAGFNTVDISALSNATLFVMLIYMFIGASPGGTGGGIKTTTFGVVLLSTWAMIRGNDEARVFKQRIPNDIIVKTFQLCTLAVVLISIVTLSLVALEDKDFFSILFEVVSAFGTVGLSFGDGSIHSFSATFTNTGKLFIVLAMFIGRVGTVTVFTAMAHGKKQSRFRLSKGKLMIG